MTTVNGSGLVALADRIELWPFDRLRPYDRNPRTHSEAQVDQIAASMVEFGWTNPVLVDEQGGILAGHGRLLAARKLGLSKPGDLWILGDHRLLCGDAAGDRTGRACRADRAVADGPPASLRAQSADAQRGAGRSDRGVDNSVWLDGCAPRGCLSSPAVLLPGECHHPSRCST